MSQRKLTQRELKFVQLLVFFCFVFIFFLVSFIPYPLFIPLCQVYFLFFFKSKCFFFDFKCVQSFSILSDIYSLFSFVHCSDKNKDVGQNHVVKITAPVRT